MPEIIVKTKKGEEIKGRIPDPDDRVNKFYFNYENDYGEELKACLDIRTERIYYEEEGSRPPGRVAEFTIKYDK